MSGGAAHALARLALAVSLALAALPAPGEERAAPPDGAAPPPVGEPKLVLEASPRLGFRPLHVSLTATLTGVSRDDDNFCHVDQIWLGRRASDPETRERASASRPRCHHPPDQRVVETRFYKDVTLSSPGIFTYRLVLEPKDGRRVISNPVTIQILARP